MGSQSIDSIARPITMPHFHYKKGKLFCEEVPMADLAERYGTPLYVYSKASIVEACRSLGHAFKEYPTLCCFALKANANLSLVKLIGEHGLGADIVSVGELERALRAGIPADKIVFSGVGKREDELKRGLDASILSFQSESITELKRLNNLAEKAERIARISLRINPNIDAKTNPHITTGLYSTKFGIAEHQLPLALKTLKTLPRLKLIGLSCHLGSQIASLAPFRSGARRMGQLVDLVRKAGFDLDFLDLGGGLPIEYRNEKLFSLSQYAQAILPSVKRTGLRLVLEPGRFVIGSSGALLTRVIDVKRTPRRRFVIVDAGMTDLIRPVLYGAYHEISPVNSRPARRKVQVDIVGPICESADYFAKGKRLEEVVSKDLIVIRDCGAYGFSMSSHYNSRPNAAEVLVDRKDSKLIRRREPLDALWAPEVF